MCREEGSQGEFLTSGNRQRGGVDLITRRGGKGKTLRFTVASKGRGKRGNGTYLCDCCERRRRTFFQDEGEKGTVDEQKIVP